jgi:restriction endonuclease Mrr
MIDHPYAKTAAKYANIGSEVAGKLGYGKKKHRKHMRGRGGGGEDYYTSEEQLLGDQKKAQEAIKKGFSEADVRKAFPHLT